MGHVEGQSRYQRALCAASLDEQLGKEHPVRVIDGFVDALDLQALGFSKVIAEETGRPAYRPGDLAKLYVYGYTNQMRSSRRLAREAQRNLEVRWLINAVTPSFKTIADFRKDHPEAIVGICRAFMQFCRGQSLIAGAVVAIDGTKIEAVASRKKAITPKSVEKQLAAVERKIEEYLAAMDEADREEAAVSDPPVDVAGALAALEERRMALQVQAQTLAKKGLSQLVIGEPEARLMLTARHGHQVAYNAQTAVDAKHGLIAAFDLTSESNDHRLLLPMALQAQEVLQAETLTVVADSGYSNGEHGHQCQEAGITAVVPRAQTVNPTGKQYFSRDAFDYDGERDVFTCPAGQTLAVIKVSQTERNKTYATKACAGCALRPQCTRTARRSVVRSFYEDDRQAMHERALADPTWMKLRREVVEHPYGTMKWMMGYPRFLVRGPTKANAELALTIMGYNLKRAITILGVPAILEALADPAAAPA